MPWGIWAVAFMPSLMWVPHIQLEESLLSPGSLGHRLGLATGGQISCGKSRGGCREVTQLVLRRAASALQVTQFLQVPSAVLRNRQLCHRLECAATSSPAPRHGECREQRAAHCKFVLFYLLCCALGDASTIRVPTKLMCPLST